MLMIGRELLGRRDQVPVSKAGKLENALELFEEMEIWLVRPNATSYSVTTSAGEWSENRKRHWN